MCGMLDWPGALHAPAFLRTRARVHERGRRSSAGPTRPLTPSGSRSRTDESAPPPVLAQRCHSDGAGVGFAVGSLVLGSGAAHADEADEQQLADTFAPVLMLVVQDKPCGPGEPYQPSDIDL